MSTTFMKVQDVADELGVSKSYAYKIVQKLNDELKAQGFITISGRINNKGLIPTLNISCLNLLL